ncbi:MAG: tRNA (guanosine(37)-N1)-methyltransferase TrmD [Bacillota bacterium]
MRADILTLFPEMFESVLACSMMGRACQGGLIDVHLHNIRDYADNKHKQADDYPFGGGQGMVIMPQPVFGCMAHVRALSPKGRCIHLSPRGSVLNTKKARALAEEEALILLCSHYEGIDQRVIDELVDEEISIGDYVLTGGELPAMVLLDCVSRFIPGVLGCAHSAQDESFGENGLLEYPQYTRPADFRGLRVPDVLLSGHHANIAKWRHAESLRITKKNRPDLLEHAGLSEEDVRILEEGE